MGVIETLRGWARDVIRPPLTVTMLDAQARQTFDTAPRPVDQVITAMKYGDLGRVTRAQALSVAAVQRGRNELCSIATLPLRLYSGLDVVDSPLFRQFDPDVPNIAHMAATIEDLAFEGLAWWQITGQDFDGYPASVRRVDPTTGTLKPPGKNVQQPPLSAGYQVATSAPGQTGTYVWIDRGDGRGP